MSVIEKCYQLAEQHAKKKIPFLVMASLFFIVAAGLSVLDSSNDFYSSTATCLGLLGLECLTLFYFILFFGKKLSKNTSFDSNYMFTVFQEWLVAISLGIVTLLVPLVIFAIVF